MKVSSKDVYKILREALAPKLKTAGFKHISGGMLGWYKPTDGRAIAFIRHGLF